MPARPACGSNDCRQIILLEVPDSFLTFIMAKRKRKLTLAEKADKLRRQKEYMTVFINGKQKRVKRSPTIDGVDVDEFIRRNADPIWLHQNEMWEYMDKSQDE